MQFEYDPMQLIEEVKSRPGLWDFNSWEYKSKHARNKLWLEVVKALNPNTGDLSMSDLHELEVQLQKRWKSMRDAFTKQVRRPDRFKNKKRYLYYNDLLFLKDSAAQSHARSEDSPSESGNTRKRRSNFKRAFAKVRRESEEYEEVTYLKDNSSDEDVTEVPVVKQVKSPNVQNFVFADVEESPPHSSSPKKNDDSDPDRLFLLSLLPNLQAVPEKIKLEVKMNMMQVLQSALDGASSYNEIY